MPVPWLCSQAILRTFDTDLHLAYFSWESCQFSNAFPFVLFTVRVKHVRVCLWKTVLVQRPSQQSECKPAVTQLNKSAASRNFYQFSFTSTSNVDVGSECRRVIFVGVKDILNLWDHCHCHCSTFETFHAMLCPHFAPARSIMQPMGNEAITCQSWLIINTKQKCLRLTLPLKFSVPIRS